MKRIDKNNQKPGLSDGQRGRQRSLLAASHPVELQNAQEKFGRALQARNRSQQTIGAYRSDIRLFFDWLLEQNPFVTSPEDVTADDLIDYLAELGRQQLAGVTRARKLAALREFFRFLKLSPAEDIQTPKKASKTRQAFRPEDYNKLLALAGTNARDYAILQVFLQTGVRVGELCHLTLDDVDMDGRMVHVRDAKGQTERHIELEKKVILALKSWLAVRPDAASSLLFLNRYGEPISDRGVRKMVTKYLSEAGIRNGSPHLFRHTFATIKAEKLVSPFQLQEWLGHRNLNTTQIYVHMAKTNAKKVMEATSL